MPSSSDTFQHIELHVDAPLKPLPGQSCNGCGVCCAAEPCSLARTVLRQQEGVCRALRWEGQERRYRCGLVISPSGNRAWLRPVAMIAEAIFHRWIAAGKGCDSDAVVVEEEHR